MCGCLKAPFFKASIVHLLSWLGSRESRKVYEADEQKSLWSSLMTNKHSLYNFSHKHQMGLWLKVKIDKWNMLNKILNRNTCPISVGYLWNRKVKALYFYALACGNNFTSEMLQEHLSIMGFVLPALAVPCREHSAHSAWTPFYLALIH